MLLFCHACPTPGACPFMGTANTMCAMAEILGFSPHGNASVRSQSEKWHQMAREAARKVVEAVKEEKRPSGFVTQKSLENVVRYMMATGRFYQQFAAYSGTGKTDGI